MHVLLLASALALVAASAPYDAKDIEAALHDALLPLTQEGSHLHAPVVSFDGNVVESEATITPVVLMHGLGDAGSNPGMQSLAKTVMDKYPGSYAVAVDVANGLSSFFQHMQPQVDDFAKVVKADPKLADGFNVVGLSQGGLIVRAYVQQYSGRDGYPAVNRLISICGVQNGVFNCPLEVQIIPFVCKLFETSPYNFLDIPLSFSDYFKDPANETKYLHENKYLPDINNELPAKNASYKAAIQALDLMYLIEATKDTVVYPFESEQFGGYEWGTKDTVFNLTSSAQYKQDWLGLKTLDDAGKLKFNSFVGDHLRFSDEYWNTVVLPLLA